MPRLLDLTADIDNVKIQIANVYAFFKAQDQKTQKSLQLGVLKNIRNHMDSLIHIDTQQAEDLYNLFYGHCIFDEIKEYDGSGKSSILGSAWRKKKNPF